MKRLAFLGAVSVVVAACAMQRSPNGPNFDRGVWGMQAINPPAGLLTAQQGDLINRLIANPYGPSPLAVKYTLVDPTTGDARYVVVTAKDPDNYVVIPVSALKIAPGGISTTATSDELGDLPHYSLGKLEDRYPRTVLTQVPASPAAGGGSAAPAVTTTSVSPYSTAPLPPTGGASQNSTAAPPASSATPPGSSSEPVQMIRSGSYVGDPVVDANGRPIGTVNAVAVTPGTNEIRYVVVATQSFGHGSFIIVPAASAQFAGDKVYVTGTPPAQ
ncbi:MAG TPA: PRC-barrel domain-containing protein [Alphaproteobacteria bacterium]|nr:PRC-barrel domain-containing protein [Alphaproteobacteria bacterium]